MMMADLLCIEGAHYQCNCQWHANDARSIGLNANSNWNISLQQPRLIIAVWREWELSVTYITSSGCTSLDRCVGRSINWMALVVECLVMMGLDRYCRSDDCVTECRYNITACLASLLAPRMRLNWDQQWSNAWAWAHALTACRPNRGEDRSPTWIRAPTLTRKSSRQPSRDVNKRDFPARDPRLHTHLSYVVPMNTVDS